MVNLVRRIYEDLIEALNYGEVGKVAAGRCLNASVSGVPALWSVVNERNAARWGDQNAP